MWLKLGLLYDPLVDEAHATFVLRDHYSKREPYLGNLMNVPLRLGCDWTLVSQVCSMLV